MNTSRHMRTDCRKQFLHGMGEGILSGMLAGVLIWYYIEHESLTDIAANLILVLAAAIVLAFPTINFLRRNWRLVFANLAGGLFLLLFGLGYMLTVWILLAHAYFNGKID